MGLITGYNSDVFISYGRLLDAIADTEMSDTTAIA